MYAIFAAMPTTWLTLRMTDDAIMADKSFKLLTLIFARNVKT